MLKCFLKNDCQENTSAGTSFLRKIDLICRMATIFIKKDTLVQMFSYEYCETFIRALIMQSSNKRMKNLAGHFSEAAVRTLFQNRRF